MLRLAVPDPYETRMVSPRHLKERIEAERTGIPFLYWLDDAGEQHLLMLTADHTRVTIGRRDQSDVPLTWDGEVSRAHALLEPVGGEWTLIDDGLALNGTYVNGSRIHGRHRLEDKDHMYFGQTRVVYREPGERAGQSINRAGAGFAGLDPADRDASEAADRAVPPNCRVELGDARDQPADRGRGAPERRRRQGSHAAPVRPVRAW